MSTKEEDNFSRSFRNAVHHALSSKFEHVRQLKPVQEEALLQFIRRNASHGAENRFGEIFDPDLAWK